MDKETCGHEFIITTMESKPLQENSKLFSWTGLKRAMGITQPILHIRPSWNSTFAATIKTLRLAAYSVPRNVRLIRTITDHSIPTWLPTIPAGVRVMSATNPNGEWFYPAGTWVVVFSYISYVAQ